MSRHGPALARGVRGEISYILTRKPRTVARSLAIGLAMGLLYLGFLRAFDWDTKQRLLPYLGLWAISVVMGGAVCINAMSFDAMRVRAALDSGARLWHILVIKNLALTCIVAPLGFLLSALLAWRAGDFGAQSGSLKQFLIAFTVSYLIGYLVNLMLIWRVFAAQELAARLGSVLIPAILVVLSSAVMWLLLTVFAIALAQQPKIRRVLMREISDYTSNAEAQAFAEEAARTASTAPDAVDASARKPSR